MRRCWLLPLLLPCFFILAGGCKREPAKDPDQGNLMLTLPESADTQRSDRVSKLTIDGKDYSEPRATKRTLQVAPATGTNEVTIVFSFWPKSYVNTIRTKKVKLNADKPTLVDLTQSEPDDLIKPIYVPTSMEVAEQMCKMADIKENDVVYDIGCGDGRMVIMAVEKFGAKRGVGIDIRDELITECKANAKKAKVADRVDFRAGDALKIKDFSEATVVLLYLGDELNAALKPDLKASLKPGARVVSHRFSMGADWPPDKSQPIVTTTPDNPEKDYDLLLWRIK